MFLMPVPISCVECVFHSKILEEVVVDNWIDAEFSNLISSAIRLNEIWKMLLVACTV